MRAATTTRSWVEAGPEMDPRKNPDRYGKITATRVIAATADASENGFGLTTAAKIVNAGARRENSHATTLRSWMRKEIARRSVPAIASKGGSYPVRKSE
jgi:hypothetical protein